MDSSWISLGCLVAALADCIVDVSGRGVGAMDSALCLRFGCVIGVIVWRVTRARQTMLGVFLLCIFG